MDELQIDKKQTALNRVFQKFLVVFVLALIVVAIGILVGPLVPAVLLVPLMVLELILIIVMVFAGKTRLGYLLMYSFMFISGITVYAILVHYTRVAGIGAVLTVLLLAIGIFVALAIFGSLTKFDFGFMGNALFFALLALLSIYIIGIFFPFSSALNTALAVGGVLLFSGFTIYNFNQIAKRGLREEEIPSMVLNVYLDFLNLFLHLLDLIIYFIVAIFTD